MGEGRSYGAIPFAGASARVNGPIRGPVVAEAESA